MGGELESVVTAAQSIDTKWRDTGGSTVPVCVYACVVTPAWPQGEVCADRNSQGFTAMIKLPPQMLRGATGELRERHFWYNRKF